MKRFEPVLTKSQQRRMKRTRLFEVSQTVLLVALGLALLLFAIREMLAAGQAAVGIFAVIGVVMRVRAEIAFKAALGTFVAIPLAAIFSPNPAVSENLAVFGFLLLIVGVCFSLVELLRQRMRTQARERR